MKVLITFTASSARWTVATWRRRNGPRARELAKELRAFAQRFPNVADIQLQRSSFASIRLHRNNAYYGLLLKIAELAFDCLIPQPSGKGFVFNDVLRDEKKMARVFEEFVRNFYRAEQRTFAVEPLTLMWDAIPLTSGILDQLPMMRVDVLLRSEHRNIIIDTKYYAETLQSYHGRESVHSENLYQIFSYLKNATAKHPELSVADGMLLYPEVQRTLDASYLIQGHRTRIATVDLAKPWPAAAAGILLKIFASPRYDRASIVLYLLLGWSGLLAFESVLNALPRSTVTLLVAACFASKVLYSGTPT